MSKVEWIAGVGRCVFGIAFVSKHAIVLMVALLSRKIGMFSRQAVRIVVLW